MLFLFEVINATFLVSALSHRSLLTIHILILPSVLVLGDRFLRTDLVCRIKTCKVDLVGGCLWQGGRCYFEELIWSSDDLMRLLKHAWCLFLVRCGCLGCLSSRADHPAAAACMLAQSPSSHSWRLQSEPCQSSSLMAITHECRLYKHIGPDGIPYALVVVQDMYTLQELLDKIVSHFGLRQ